MQPFREANALRQALIDAGTVQQRSSAERSQSPGAPTDPAPLQDAIFHSRNFASIATDASGVIRNFNGGAERMLGYEAGEVIGRMTPADLADPEEIVARADALGMESGATIVAGFEALVFKTSLGIGDIFELTFGLASFEAQGPLQSTPVVLGRRALFGVRVLIVDDSDINLDVTERILENEGGEVMLAKNGQEALEILRADPQAIDVVLMDVQMPVLDGHDATRWIRLELALTDLPIIGLTASALSSERQRAAAAGMDDYLVKPFDPQSLVASILRRLKTTAARPDSSKRVVAANPVPRATQPWIEIDGIDTRDARTRMGDDFELFRSLLGRLLDEFGGTPVPAAANGETAIALEAGRLHKLRGSAGLLGATAIQALAAEAETACRAGEADRAEALTARIAVRLELRGRAGSILVAPRVTTKAVGHPDDLEPGSLSGLLALLRQQNLSASDRFDLLGPGLLRRLGSVSYERVRDQMENLRYSEAADAIDAG